MTIFNVGTDIVQVERMRKAIERHGDKFAERILSANELIKYQEVKQKAHYLAKRFAGKEAVAKALGTGIAEGLAFNQISILNNDKGQPFVAYSGKAEELVLQYKITQTHISLADEKDFAVAFVTLVKD